MAPSSKAIIMIAISAIVASVVVPMGLALIAGAGSTVVYYPNGTSAGTLTSLGNANVLTMLTVILPIVIVVALIIYNIPKMKG